MGKIDGRNLAKVVHANNVRAVESNNAETLAVQQQCMLSTHLSRFDTQFQDSILPSMLSYIKTLDSTASENPLTKKNGESRDVFVGWVVKTGHGSDSTGVNRMDATGFPPIWAGVF